jgi:hypothetical protein
LQTTLGGGGRFLCPFCGHAMIEDQMPRRPEEPAAHLLLCNNGECPLRGKPFYAPPFDLTPVPVESLIAARTAEGTIAGHHNCFWILG